MARQMRCTRTYALSEQGLLFHQENLLALYEYMRRWHEVGKKSLFEHKRFYSEVFLPCYSRTAEKKSGLSQLMTHPHRRYLVLFSVGIGYNACLEARAYNFCVHTTLVSS